jgi:hypothetical protein
MIVWIVLAACVVALLLLFVLQWKRSRQNAEETARLRATGIKWDDWFARHAIGSSHAPPQRNLPPDVGQSLPRVTSR